MNEIFVSELQKCSIHTAPEGKISENLPSGSEKIFPEGKNLPSRGKKTLSQDLNKEIRPRPWPVYWLAPPGFGRQGSGPSKRYKGNVVLNERRTTSS